MIAWRWLAENKQVATDGHTQRECPVSVTKGFALRGLSGRRLQESSLTPSSLSSHTPLRLFLPLRIPLFPSFKSCPLTGFTATPGTPLAFGILRPHFKCAQSPAFRPLLICCLLPCRPFASVLASTRSSSPHFVVPSDSPGCQPPALQKCTAGPPSRRRSCWRTSQKRLIRQPLSLWRPEVE